MRSIFELITYTLQLSTENTGLVISDGANIMLFFLIPNNFRHPENEMAEIYYGFSC